MKSKISAVQKLTKERNAARAANKALREVLKEIAAVCDGTGAPCQYASDIARSALGAKSAKAIMAVFEE